MRVRIFFAPVTSWACCKITVKINYMLHIPLPTSHTVELQCEGLLMFFEVLNENNMFRLRCISLACCFSEKVDFVQCTFKKSP